MQNKRIVVLRRPNGIPIPTDFVIEETLIPDVTENSILVRNKYIGITPGDLLKMQTSLPLGGVINGYTIGEVVECHPTVSRLRVGDMILAKTGWVEYSRINAENAEILDDSGIALLDNLSILGMPGLTAFHGLHKVARISRGQKILINVASGVVGSLACQLASRYGLEVTAVVSNRNGRAEWVSKHIKTHEIILQSEMSHWSRTNTTFYNHFYENIGASSINEIIHHSLKNSFRGTKITLCGAISDYPNWKEQLPNLDVVGIMEAAITLQGFQLSQFNADHKNAREAIRKQHAKQPFLVKTEIIHGIDQLPIAYCDFYNRKIFGKVIIQVY
jgi:NADPH-dependent curcumin reductase CurA